MATNSFLSSLTGSLCLAVALTACSAPPPPRAIPQSANPSAVIAAEMAFNRLAQDKGQWTAFRETATRDAMMFVPEPVKAQEWLKGRADPASSVRWQPHRAFMACDGKTGVTTGAWQRPDGSTGYFTTIWQWQPKSKAPENQVSGVLGNGDWKWVLDHGDAMNTPLPSPEMIDTKTASCKGKPGALLMAPPEGAQMKVGFSFDQTLQWTWIVPADNSRTLEIKLWNGTDFDVVRFDSVVAPGAPAAR